MTRDVIVIGAGLFGSVIAKALMRCKHDVVVIDDKRDFAGSAPAACLMKPSWFSGLGPKIYRPALDILNGMYGVRDLQMRVGPANALVHWINPRDILADPSLERIRGRVNKITQDGNCWRVQYVMNTGSEVDIWGRAVVVAAGVWTSELLPVPGLEGRSGVAFTWDGQVSDQSITPWAPYRQLVIFNRGANEVWASDGTALKKWTDAAESICERRVVDAVRKANPHITAMPTPLVGIRPYVKDAKPAYLREHMPRLWAATGGAKNGTLAAGWCATQLVEALL